MMSVVSLLLYSLPLLYSLLIATEILCWQINQAKEDPSVMFKFWTIQGIWVFVTLLPTLLLNRL